MIYSNFDGVDPSYIILFNCCMLHCRGCGPVAAVGRQLPPWSMDATIPIVEESSPPVPFPPSSSPPPPHIVPKRRLFRADVIQRVRGAAIDSARRPPSETSDPDDDDAPPDLTGDYRQSPVQISTYSYVEKTKTQATDRPHRRVVIRGV